MIKLLIVKIIEALSPNKRLDIIPVGKSQIINGLNGPPVKNVQYAGARKRTDKNMIDAIKGFLFFIPQEIIIPIKKILGAIKLYHAFQKAKKIIKLNPRINEAFKY